MSDPNPGDVAELLHELDRARIASNGIGLPPELHASCARLAGELYRPYAQLDARFQNIQVDSVVILEPIDTQVALAGTLCVEKVAIYTPPFGDELKLFEGTFGPLDDDDDLRPCYGSTTHHETLHLVEGLPRYDLVRNWLSRSR